MAAPIADEENQLQAAERPMTENEIKAAPSEQLDDALEHVSRNPSFDLTAMDSRNGQRAPSTRSSTVAEPTPAAEVLPTTNGYLTMAQFNGEFPEYAIYRCFGTLNSMNLLMLQAELIMLELRLRQYIKEDNASTDTVTRLYNKNFVLSSGHMPCVRKGRSRQYQLILRIRQVLRQYSA